MPSGYQKNWGEEKNYEKKYEENYRSGRAEFIFGLDGNDGLCPRTKNSHYNEHSAYIGWEMGGVDELY